MSDNTNAIFCKNCHWWDPRDEEELTGFCRVLPPVTAGMAMPMSIDAIQHPQKGVWPETRCDDFCKEWEKIRTNRI